MLMSTDLSNDDGLNILLNKMNESLKTESVDPKRWILANIF